MALFSSSVKYNPPPLFFHWPVAFDEESIQPKRRTCFCAGVECSLLYAPSAETLPSISGSCPGIFVPFCLFTLQKSSPPKLLFFFPGLLFIYQSTLISIKSWVFGLLAVPQKDRKIAYVEEDLTEFLPFLTSGKSSPLSVTFFAFHFTG